MTMLAFECNVAMGVIREAGWLAWRLAWRFLLCSLGCVSKLGEQGLGLAPVWRLGLPVLAGRLDVKIET